MLIAYAGAAMGRLDPKRPASLLANLLGAAAILYSLFTEAFNISAVAMEGAWLLVSGAGLIRWAYHAGKTRK
jgi:hypothetical protein